jgi:hypothetical protein
MLTAMPGLLGTLLKFESSSYSGNAAKRKKKQVNQL